MTDSPQTIALRKERDELLSRLPAGLPEKLQESLDLAFDCGEHDEGDDEPYESRYFRSLRAEIALLTTLLQLLSDKKPTPRRSAILSRKSFFER